MSYGAEVNVKDIFDKKTALHRASNNGYIDIVQMLLDTDAELNVKNNCHDLPHPSILNILHH